MRPTEHALEGAGESGDGMYRIPGKILLWILAVVAAISMRFWLLGVPLLDADESHWFSWAMWPDTLFRTTPINAEPRPDFLFPLMIRPLAVLSGYRESGLRLISVVSGLLAGVVLARIVARCAREASWAPLFACCAMWTLPVAVWGSRHLIPDMTAVLFVCLAVEGMTGPAPHRLSLLAWAAWIALAALTKATSALLLPGLAIFAATTRRECEPRALPRATTVFAAFAPFLLTALILKARGETLAFWDTHRVSFGIDAARAVRLPHLLLLGTGLWAVPAAMGIAALRRDASLRCFRPYAWLLTPVVLFPFLRVTAKEILWLTPALAIFAGIGADAFLRNRADSRRCAALLLMAMIAFPILAQGAYRTSMPLLPSRKLIAAAETADMLREAFTEDFSFVVCSAKYFEPITRRLGRSHRVFWVRTPHQAIEFAGPLRLMLLRVPYDGAFREDRRWEEAVHEIPLPDGVQFRLFAFDAPDYGPERTGAADAGTEARDATLLPPGHP